MLQVNRVRELVLEIKTAISEIKFAEVLITDDDFKKFLEERKSSENILFFAVLPDYGVTGSEDKTKYDNYIQFFMLEKSVEKNLKHSEKLDLYNRVQLTVKQFIDLIIEAKSGESDVFSACNLFSDLNEESIDVKVFWDGVQSRVYEIFINIYTK